MTKKDLKINLVDLGIHKEKYLHEDAVDQYGEDEIYRKDGHSYLIYDTELSSDEINTAILAKQAKDITTIRKMVSFFVGITLFSLIVSVISIICALV